GAAQVDVRVVLPGEADAAEDLDGVAGGLHAGVERDDGGDRRGEADLRRPGRPGALVQGAGRVPGGGAGLLQRDEAARGLVLDALELPDRAAELLADPGVLGRGRHQPAGEPGGLGAEQRGGEVPDAPGGDAVQDAVGGDGGAGDLDGGDAADRVEALDGGDGDVGGVDRDP